jgi:hypothetical protein
MNNMINYSSDFRSSLKVKSVISDGHGNTTTTAILSFPSSKSHLLDKVLFHQMHVPYIPNTAVYSPTTFLEGGLSQPPSPDTTSPCTTNPIDDDDLVSVGSSSHDSCGSFQTVEDLENEELVDIFDDEEFGETESIRQAEDGVLHDRHGTVTNWMIAKKLAFDRKQHAPPPPPQLLVETSLIQLLIKHKAPLHLYPSIQEWAKESASLGYDFTRRFRSRSKVLSELEARFDFQSSKFQPTVISYLPDERPTTVYVSSFADAVYSILSDPELMDESNLAFPDPFNPFLSEPEDPSLQTNEVSELFHGDFYKATHKEVCTGPLDVLCLYICYMDGVSTDAFGRLGLTPLNMTLGILKSATRTRKEAWVTLYFHPDDNAESAYHAQKQHHKFPK